MFAKKHRYDFDFENEVIFIDGKSFEIGGFLKLSCSKIDLITYDDLVYNFYFNDNNISFYEEDLSDEYEKFLIYIKGKSELKKYYYNPDWDKIFSKPFFKGEVTILELRIQ
ncbi:MAG: hypothetical protein KDJ80_09635 [Nitratireductor sp.]|nr:hypothetical protein [Nitratireductor sp.]